MNYRRPLGSHSLGSTALNIKANKGVRTGLEFSFYQHKKDRRKPTMMNLITFGRKVRHGPRKNRLCFGEDPSRVTSP